MNSQNKLHFEKFFTEEWPSRTECDEYAQRKYGDNGRLLLHLAQGDNSYTIMGSFIVQFRKERFAPEKFNLATAPFAKYVPKILDEHRFGNFWVYKRVALTGIFFDRRFIRTDTGERIALTQRTMGDLATFHAGSILKRAADQPPPRAKLADHCRQLLSEIGISLPVKYLHTISYLMANVHRLFEADWPMVVSNVGLGPDNVVVDADGRMLGCLQWEDTEVLPFGVALANTNRFLGQFTTRGAGPDARKFWDAAAGSKGSKWHFLNTLKKKLGDKSAVMSDERLAIAEMLGVILDRSRGFGKCLEENDYPMLLDDDYRMSFLDHYFWTGGESVAEWMGKQWNERKGKLVQAKEIF